MHLERNRRGKCLEGLPVCRLVVSDQQNQLIRFGQAELLACQTFDGYRRRLERPDFLEKLLGFGFERRYFLLEGLKILVCVQKLDEAAVSKQCVEQG